MGPSQLVAWRCVTVCVWGALLLLKDGKKRRKTKNCASYIVLGKLPLFSSLFYSVYSQWTELTPENRKKTTEFRAIKGEEDRRKKTRQCKVRRLNSQDEKEDWGIINPVCVCIKKVDPPNCPRTLSVIEPYLRVRAVNKHCGFSSLAEEQAKKEIQHNSEQKLAVVSTFSFFCLSSPQIIRSFSY